MMIFILQEITTSDIALQTAKELVVEAIDASNSQRGRSKKIKAAESKIKKLIALCRAKVAMSEKGDWRAPVVAMHNSIKVLEDAKAESDASIWSI